MTDMSDACRAPVATLAKHPTWAWVMAPGLVVGLQWLSWPVLSQTPTPLARAGTEPPAAPLARAITLREPQSLMLRVAAGTLRMGSTKKEIAWAATLCNRHAVGTPCNLQTFANELPLHSVSFEEYWLDRTEVSVRHYENCVRLRRCTPIDYSEGAERFRAPQLPATMVTREQAERYCAFREARLPSEVELERAARGLRRRHFPWGNLYNSRLANHGRDGAVRHDDSDGYAELSPVDAFIDGKTPEGFLNLAGNVAEWTRDAYTDDYSTEATRGKSSGGRGGLVAVRGGDFESGPAALRGSARGFANPSARLPTLGFRCARTTATPSHAAASE